MSERMFPIMDGPDIPWRMISPYENQARRNHGQSLERLAQRHGLSPVEAIAVIEGVHLSVLDVGQKNQQRSVEKLVAMLAADEIVELEAENARLAEDLEGTTKRRFFFQGISGRLASDALKSLAAAGISTPVETFMEAPYQLKSCIDALAKERDEAIAAQAVLVDTLSKIWVRADTSVSLSLEEKPPHSFLIDWLKEIEALARPVGRDDNIPASTQAHIAEHDELIERVKALEGVCKTILDMNPGRTYVAGDKIRTAWDDGDRARLSTIQNLVMQALTPASGKQEGGGDA